MNILYLSYDGMTDPLGQSQVLPYLVGLSQFGHNVSLISCEKLYRFEKEKNTIKGICSSATIQWFPLSYSKRPSLLGKISNLYRINKQANLLAKKNQVVHCRSYMAAIIGLRLKKQFNLKFVFDMRGFWADERIDGNIWSHQNYLQHLQYLYFKKKEKEFLSTADFVISLTENAKSEILSWNISALSSEKIKVIPCCVDLNLFSKTRINEAKRVALKQKLQIDSTNFVLCYLGSIGTWYMLDEMLDFFKCLLDRKTNAKFLFITPDNKTEILNKASKKGIDTNKIIVVAANRNEVPLYLSLADFSIYFIKQAYSKKASSPTKTGEIMAMGIPIITNSGIGDSDKIVQDSNAGILINEFKDYFYNLAIDKIDSFSSSYKNIKMDNVIDYFSLERGVKLYNEVYKTLEETK
jgi:glycosyltransferase involved in cell wall biosynthesis